MPWKFNPFSGTLDQTGSGGGGSSYIDGEVQNFSALPETIGSPAVDSAYLVREAEGTWLLARKPAGIYIRTADTGVRADDWTHAGAFPDVFNDANFLLYDNGDSTKNLAFQLSGLTTGTTSTLTVPPSGTIARTEDFAAPPAIGNTTPAAGSFTTLTATEATFSSTTRIQGEARFGSSNVILRRSDGFPLITATAANGNTLFATNSIEFRGSAGSGEGVTLHRGANILEQRQSTNPQTFRLYNTYTDASNHERGFMRWSSNVLQIGTEAGGTGSARALEFQVGGVTRMTVAESGGSVTVGSAIQFGTTGIQLAATASFRFSASTIGSSSDLFIFRSGNGILGVAGSSGSFNRLQFGGTTNAYPSLKRDTTTLQVRLADDSAFTAIQGKLTTETAYTAGAPTATGYLVLYDSNGTAYKVPAEAL